MRSHTGGPASANIQLEGQLRSTVHPQANIYASKLNFYASKLNLYASKLNLYASKLNLYASKLNLYASKLNLYASKLNLYASKLNLYGCTGAHCPALVSRQVRCPWHARGVLRGQVCVCVKHSKYVPYMSLICPLYVLIWPEYGPYIS